jgi:hypothetical protein
MNLRQGLYSSANRPNVAVERVSPLDQRVKVVAMARSSAACGHMTLLGLL